VMEQQRVTIRFRIGHLGRTQRTASSTDIFYHDLLAKILRHGLGDQSCDCIGRAAGREGNDDGDGPLRIVRSGCGKWCEGECGGGRKPCKKRLHHILPPGTIFARMDIALQIADWRSVGRKRQRTNSALAELSREACLKWVDSVTFDVQERVETHTCQRTGVIPGCRRM